MVTVPPSTTEINQNDPTEPPSPPSTPPSDRYVLMLSGKQHQVVGEELR
jgi:hypothetical protein